MMKRRALVASTLLGAIVLGTAGVAAADILTVNVPAPVSHATGTALSVGGVVGVGTTDSSATPTSGDAVANAVEIGGTPPLAVLGSTQNGPGTTSNKLLDTTQTPLGRLQVAPSSATVTDANGVRQADSAAALARANLINPNFASIDVLQSSASATHAGMLSQAFATSDALVLNFGGPDGTTIRLLHSESSSSGKGLTYIIAVNDHPIISVTELTEQVCALQLPEILRVSCLQVSGGVGSLSTEVLNATVGGANGLSADAIKASGAGGQGAVQSVSTPAAPEVEAVSLSRGSESSRALARTGAGILFTASLALALVTLGLVLVGMRKVTAETR